jgi:hypothetical protein
MGLGPVLSATELLKRNELTLGDIETWELNEAFATQVLGCLAAWNDENLQGNFGPTARPANSTDQTERRWRRHQPRPSVGCSGNRMLHRQRHEAAGHTARHRHRMYRRRAGRRDADRDGVIMDSQIMNLLGDRVLELGPKPDADGPYKNFKLTRDADGVAWLLFDREGTSANTLSADLIEELDKVLAELEGQRPTGLVIRSAKKSGFIAGADVNAFRGASDAGRSRPRSAARMP